LRTLILANGMFGITVICFSLLATYHE